MCQWATSQRSPLDKEASVAKANEVLGAIFGVSKTKGDKKLQPKPRKNKTTRGEGSAHQGQQHGEMFSAKMPTEKQMNKDMARAAKRHATDAWVRGTMSDKEHSATHRRADSVLKGKAGKSRLW
jgi:hypothetical protein